MRVAKSILLLLSGAVAGITFLLSCGDNWHLSADAAIDAPKVADAAPVCDCPAAEPPLAGRLVEVSVFAVVGANGHGSNNLLCPTGMRPISGSCTVNNPIPDKEVILRESGFIDNPPAWRCSFRNNEPMPVTYKIAVLCLKPAP